jgi:signal transduction histidine kinase
MLERALQLCDSSFGALHTFDGEEFHSAATRFRTSSDRRLEAHTLRPDPGSAMAQLVAGASVVHIADVADTDEYRAGVAPRVLIVEEVGARTALWVALRNDDILLGVFTIYRREVRPFTDRQIALMQNFAAQAVIAMENARLLTETREALEQQTATAEVLGIINASPGDLAPVFDAMLEKAMRLCGAAYGVLRSFDGESAHLLASRGVPSEYAGFLARNAALGTPPAGTGFMQALQTGQPTQTMDARESVGYRSGAPGGRAIADLGGARTVIHVPLVKDQVSIGLFTLYRQEVRSFSDKQIALLENFAAQAVIAMENARLLNEQREALEQQTATAEVLQVINASPGNLQPVFDAIISKAVRLCQAEFGGFLKFDGEAFHILTGASSVRQPELLRPEPGTALAQLLGGAAFVHIADVADDEAYQARSPARVRLVEGFGARTTLFVGLRKDDVLLGTLVIFRREVREFTERQISLVQGFAAHAVIAMENARLLNEVRQRQEELRITFENMGDGVALFDETPRLVAWNGHFQEMFNLPDDLLEQHRTYEEHLRFLAARGDFGGGLDAEEQLSALIATTDKPSAYERTRPDGRVLEIRRNPVPGGGFVLIFSDITERKQNEAEIRAARDAAEEASRTIEAAYRDLKAAQANLIQAEKMASLGQLTAGIAHEIKNPLNFVNNFASLSVDLLDELKETAAPGFAMLDEARRAEIDDLTRTLTGNLEKINEHGNRADAIVRSMLEHSRGSSGERRSVNLNTLVDEALNLAYHGARAQDQSFNVALQRDLDGSIAPITLVPQDITRVLLNLFNNGFYAARRRQSMEGATGFEPTLRVATRELGDAVEIRVRDNGIGIAEEVKDKLFQPFFTTKPTGEGTGLGLSISYDIVTQQHGGSIRVESKVGEFSEFTIRLPRHP